MRKYVLKRLLLIPVTLFIIVLVNFVFIQLSPGGPVDYIISKYQNPDKSAINIISNQGGEVSARKSDTKYRGGEGVDPEFIKELEKQFGFDKPIHIRFFKLMKDYLTFNLGKSFYQDKTVLELIGEKMPVSISLGVFSTLLIYLLSIPLGVKKAKQEGSKFDNITSYTVVVLYAIPGFLFAVFLIVFFAGGRFLDWFPLRGLVSDNFNDLSFFMKIVDYLHHLVLPVISMAIGGFATLTMLTKNSFLEEMNKQYVMTARAKGLTENKILYGHVFRNAMLLVIAGFPAMLISMLFKGSVLIEVIFSLDGLGLLGFNAVMTRDYPVIFGTLYIFSILGLVLNLISDITYHLVDPRIDFEKRKI